MPSRKGAIRRATTADLWEGVSSRTSIPQSQRLSPRSYTTEARAANQLSMRATQIRAGQRQDCPWRPRAAWGCEGSQPACAVGGTSQTSIERGPSCSCWVRFALDDPTGMLVATSVVGGAHAPAVATGPSDQPTLRRRGFHLGHQAGTLPKRTAIGTGGGRPEHSRCALLGSQRQRRECAVDVVYGRSRCEARSSRKPASKCAAHFEGTAAWFPRA
ncbi:hypothetical protein ABIB94_007929 [Bradyrhizobium sp. JR7.2]